MLKLISDCPYCEGKGYVRLIGVLSRKEHTNYCLDCDGTGLRCRSCCLPPTQCECSEGKKTVEIKPEVVNEDNWWYD